MHTYGFAVIAEIAILGLDRGIQHEFKGSDREAEKTRSRVAELEQDVARSQAEAETLVRDHSKPPPG